MSILIIVKSVCRRGALLLTLLALFAGILLCGSLDRETGLPRGGVTGGGTDACAAALTDALVGDGLLAYGSEAALRTAMQSGEISMGIVLPDDLTARLAARDTDGVLRFLDTPTAAFSSLLRLRVTARLAEIYAPYLTAGALADAGVERSAADMRAAIDAYRASDIPFRFTYETVDGVPIAAEGHGTRAVRGWISLLLFCLFGFFASPFSGDTLHRLSGRLGAKHTLTKLVLPGVCTVLVLAVTVCAAALSLCDHCFGTKVMQLFPAVVCYAFFLSGIGLLLAVLTGDAAAKSLILAVWSLLSVAFCPIFFDLPALLGFAWIQALLPPAFLTWAEHGGMAAPAAAIGTWLGAFALYALLPRYSRKN